MPTVAETDEPGSLQLSYNLWANGGKLELTVENTGDKPVYVDWLQSTLSINNQAYTLYNPTVVTAAEAIGVADPTDAYGLKRSRAFSRSVTKEINRIDIIPPNMHVTRTFYENSLTENLEICELNTNGKGVESVNYEELATPFEFNISVAYCDQIECPAPEFQSATFYVNAIALYTDAKFKGKLKYGKDCNGRSRSYYPYPKADSDNYYFKEAESKRSGAGILIVLACAAFAVAVLGGAI